MLNPLSAWFGRLRRSGRTRHHRQFYASYVGERPRTREERVAFHLHHLGLYWSRCLGILDASRPVGPSFLAGDWMLVILVGTEAAAADVATFCAARGAAELGAAWESYEQALVRARRGVPGVEPALRAAAAAYERVRQAYAVQGSGGGDGSRPAG